MWLQWQAAVVLAVIGALVGFAWSRATAAWMRAVAAFGRELALVLSLYTIWILAGRLAEVRVDEGLANGRWVHDLQHTLHLPSETGLQDWLLARPTLARLTNGFYAIVHVPAMVVTLIWLFFAHREKYPPWRTVLAITTFTCLLIQFVPVAPPRMYPQYGFVDVARLFDQSVYGSIGQGIADQLSAMPSVHVAWALWVAVVVIAAGVSRWRWLILAHPVMTIFAVTATANHWWADGIASAAILAAATALEFGFLAVRRRVGSARASDPSVQEPPAGANDELVPALPMRTSSGSRRSST